MHKNEARMKISQQLEQISSLRSLDSKSQIFIQWFRDTEVAVEKVFGSGTRHSADFSNIKFFPSSYVAGDKSAFINAFQRGLARAEGILKSFVREIDEYFSDDQEVQNFSNANPLDKISDICTRFHLITKQLRTRHGGRPPLIVEDEYDVQDIFRALLALHFDDIRPEEYVPSCAGASSRMDFLLKREKIVVEIKKTRKGLTEKEVGEQLIVDIERYSGHPSCETLVCFVYDPDGWIANPTGITNDLSRQGEGLEVRVIIAPTGL